MNVLLLNAMGLDCSNTQQGRNPSNYQTGIRLIMSGDQELLIISNCNIRLSMRYEMAVVVWNCEFDLGIIICSWFSSIV